MTILRLLTAASAAALLSSAAYAQTAEPAAPATSPAPAASTETPPPAAAATETAPTGTATPTAAVAPSGDLVDTLKASGQFTILVKALDAANMTQVLKSNNNLTLFAPTDAAFNALPAGQLDALMKEPTKLQALLTAHLVNATVDSSKIKGTHGPLKTVAGTDVIVDGEGAQLKVADADIVQADVRTSNGVLHVVDKVLTPGAEPPRATPAPAEGEQPAAGPAPAKGAAPKG